MPLRHSAGLLMVRLTSGAPEVLLVHPGGPFFARKDLGHWTVPKGQPDAGEDLLLTAQREFREETGFAPHPPFFPLDTIRQAGGKLVTAWAFLGDCDPAELQSNTCQIEWPPRSKQLLTIPEVDRGLVPPARSAPINQGNAAALSGSRRGPVPSETSLAMAAKSSSVISL